MAPNGSARPDSVAHQAALRRDPVASRRGTATADAFRDVVDRNRHRERDSKGWIRERYGKRGKPFREVVDGNGNDTEDAHVA